MYFAIHTLRIIIFATFISNIVTKPDDSLIRFENRVDTKEYNHDLKLKNNTHITYKKIITNNTPIYVGFAVGVLYITCFIIFILKNRLRCRFQCNRQFIRRNCLRFSECCVAHIRNFPNNPPAPDRVITRQPEAADYRDIYEMCNLPTTV